MVSKAEEFILDVRKAARLEQKPTVATDSQLIDPETGAKALRRAAMWLTPRVVATYDPTAFTVWPENLQQELNSAVEGFRLVATTVLPDQPATGQQFRDGLQAFGRLTSAVQKVVLADWEATAKKLVNQVEGWAAELQWVTRREAKKLNEILIGEYQLDQLYFHAEGHLYILDPLARFVPGGLGAFDLSIQPSFNVTSIYRHTDHEWYIHLDIGEGTQAAKTVLLTRETLGRAVAELRSML